MSWNLPRNQDKPLSGLEADVNAVLERIARCPRDGQRLLVALAGPPGTGKSTLSAEVVARLNEQMPGSAAVLPMDGFHLETETLEKMELVERRGAPQTFDVDGFVRLVERVRADTGDITYPLYDRTHERPVPDAGRLDGRTRVVVIEGNYLLLDQAPWNRLASLFDLTLFLSNSMGTLRERLMDRWLEYGYSSDAARRKVEGNDIENADLVLNNSREADLVLGRT